MDIFKHADVEPRLGVAKVDRVVVWAPPGAYVRQFNPKPCPLQRLRRSVAQCPLDFATGQSLTSMYSILSHACATPDNRNNPSISFFICDPGAYCARLMPPKYPDQWQY